MGGRLEFRDRSVGAPFRFRWVSQTIIDVAGVGPSQAGTQPISSETSAARFVELIQSQSCY